MILTFRPLPVPLSEDETGTMRVAGTRITLDLIVARFNEGASPEDIVHSFDTLRLDDVYVVLAYYLAHKDEVAAYIRAREDEAAAVRRKLESEGISRPTFWDEVKQRAARKEVERAAPAQ